MTTITNAITSSKCIKLPPTLMLKPRSQRIKNTATSVQSIIFSRAHGLSTLHIKFDSRQINQCSVLLLSREERSVELGVRPLPLETFLAANTPCSPGYCDQALGTSELPRSNAVERDLHFP